MSASRIEHAARTLATLAGRPSPDALVAVQQILAQLDSCGDPQQLEAIAEALPGHVAQLAPETGLALAKLALALARARANPRLPEDLERLEPRLQIAWLQVRLITLEDATELEAIDDLELLRAPTSDWGPLDAVSPLSLLLRMARAADARLRACVPPLLGPAIHTLALGGAEAFECLCVLAEDPERSIRVEVFRALRQPWLQGLPPAAQLQRDQLIQVGLGDRDARIVHECIELAVLLSSACACCRSGSQPGTAVRWGLISESCCARSAKSC